MSREKQGFRETIAALNEMFPEQAAMRKNEVTRFMGVDRSTIRRWGIRLNETTGMVSKADLARQISI